MLEQALCRSDQGEADFLNNTGVPVSKWGGRDPADDDDDHRGGEDPESGP